MSNSNLIRNVLIDDPSDTDGFQGKAHDSTAKVLVKAITEFDGVDRAIGLAGAWGGGKSTVVSIAEKKLKVGKKAHKYTNYHFFTFDIWKSQGSSFKRSFLEHFISWAIHEFPKKSNTLNEIQTRVRGKTLEKETSTNTQLSWYGIFVLLFIPFLPIYYFWARSVFEESITNSTNFLTSTPMLLLYLFVIITLLKAKLFLTKHNSDHPKNIIKFKDALSKTLLISSKQFSDQKVTEQIREIDPNDYEFNIILREILGAVQSKKDRIILIFDNIDRLPPDEIEDYWSQVRSVFSRGNNLKSDDPNETMTVIVPFVKDVVFPTKSNGSDVTTSGSELISKTFDEVLRVAPPVLSNTREFFLQKIKEALPNSKISDREQFICYRLFIETVEGSVTPRKVISFINDISALYVQHEGHIVLRTIAFYITNREQLDREPESVRDINSFDKKLVSIASAPDFQKQLASVVYNVDPELSYQLLLDKPISEALLMDSPDAILEISNSHGFRERIVEVVESDIPDWCANNNLGLATTNIAALQDKMNATSTNELSKPLIIALDDLDQIPMDASHYKLYFSYFKLANLTPSGSQIIVRRLIKATTASLIEIENDTVSLGDDAATYFAQLKKQITDSETMHSFSSELKFAAIPRTPYFLMGFASRSQQLGLNLQDFQIPHIVPTDNSEFSFETFTVENPLLMKDALPQLIKANLIKDKDQISISNSLITALEGNEEKKEDNIRAYLNIIQQIYVATKQEKQSEINTIELLGEGDFYSNIASLVEEDGSDVSAFVLFLMFKINEGKQPSTPTSLQANGQRTEVENEAFSTLRELYNGDKEISDSIADKVASLFIETLNSAQFIENSRSNTENQSFQKISRAIFTSKVRLRWDLPKFLSCYPYMLNLLSDDEIKEILLRFENTIANDALDEIELSSVPVGLAPISSVLGSEKWNLFNDRVTELILAISAEDWKEQILSSTHSLQILQEAISNLQFKFSGHEIREVFNELISELLSGEIDINTEIVDGDLLMQSLDARYLGDMHRKIRENLPNTSIDSVRLTSYFVPEFLSSVVTLGGKTTKVTKDSLLRNLLSPSLEGIIEGVLDSFLTVGRSKIGAWLRDCEDSTRQAVEASAEVYIDRQNNIDRRKEVGTLVFGRRRFDSLLTTMLGGSQEIELDEPDEEDN